MLQAQPDMDLNLPGHILQILVELQGATKMRDALGYVSGRVIDEHAQAGARLRLLLLVTAGTLPELQRSPVLGSRVAPGVNALFFLAGEKAVRTAPLNVAGV